MRVFLHNLWGDTPVAISPILGKYPRREGVLGWRISWDYTPPDEIDLGRDEDGYLSEPLEWERYSGNAIPLGLEGSKALGEMTRLIRVPMVRPVEPRGSYNEGALPMWLTRKEVDRLYHWCAAVKERVETPQRLLAQREWEWFGDVSVGEAPASRFLRNGLLMEAPESRRVLHEVTDWLREHPVAEADEMAIFQLGTLNYLLGT